MRTTGLEVVHPRGSGGGSGRVIDLAEAMLSLLARGLGLERAALLLEEGPGRAFVARASWGPVAIDRLAPGEEPGGGPWSAVVPVTVGDRPSGVLLLARPGGAALDGDDRALAAGVAAAAWDALDAGGLAADSVRARERLERADRLAALGMLAASVAHEIRNPMVSIRTFIQLLPERANDEEFCTSFRELALAETERICTLINDLLSFSRPAGAATLCDLSEVSAQVVRLLDAEARKRDVALTAALGSDLPTIPVDEDHVKQILMNVVLNAIEACDTHGHVVLTTSTDAARGRCVAEVADSGAGIPAADHDRIFDPFFTTKATGSGLGLFIVRRIVAEHGGTIVVRARDGGGSVFRIELPAAAEKAHGSAR